MRFIKKANKIPVKYNPEWKNNDVSVLGVIVTFNPDLERLKKNILAIADQVDHLLIVDNGSSNFEKIKSICDQTGVEDRPSDPQYNKNSCEDNINSTSCEDYKNKNISLIRYSSNQGIAKALYDAMEYAIKNKYDWVLTLDDDSIAMPNLVKNYKKFTNMPKLATMTCIMEDQNYNRNEDPIVKEFEYSYRCITSGCMMSVEAYKNSDKYQTDFFIDRVDDDICYNLSRRGYKHIKINYVGLLHEMGKGEEKQVLWHTARADHYNKVRNYYIYRNEYIIRKKYPELIRIEWLQSGRPMFVNFACSSLKVLLYENNKKEKIASMLKGWKDGRKYIRKGKNKKFETKK